MKRDFKGVWIPREIYLADDLSWSEKILLIEIDSLDDGGDKGCFASNKHFATLLSVSTGTAANLVSALRKKGYVSELWSDGKNRGLATVLRDNMLHKKMKDASRKDEAYASRKDEHNNTVGIIQESAQRFAKTKRAKNADMTDDQFLDLMRKTFHWVNVDDAMLAAEAWCIRKGRRFTRGFFQDSWLSRIGRDQSNDVIATNGNGFADVGKPLAERAAEIEDDDPLGF